MKIEPGKFYKARDGRKVGPIMPLESKVNYIFPFWAQDEKGTTLTYTADGTWYENGEWTHIFDLIEEWRDEPASVPVEEVDKETLAALAEQMPPRRYVEEMERRKPFRGYDDLAIDLTGKNSPKSWGQMAAEGYEQLAGVLAEAHDQAASGKGRERHNGRGVSFDRQPILEIGRMCGPGFNTGQAMKKIQEAMGMLQRGETDAAIRELLGAINYTAAAILLIREQKSAA